jgi:HEPN domain-containing protein
VSFLAILKHDASQFWKMSSLLEKIARGNAIGKGFGLTLADLNKALKALGLSVSSDQLVDFISRHEEETWSEEFKPFIAHLSSVIQSELKSKTFVFVPDDRAKFLDRASMEDIWAGIGFPTAEREILAAGRCYAYGEPDASMFHSMRALEVCLKALQVRFGVDDKGQWQTIIETIESKIREIGKSRVQGVSKSSEDVEDEHFYGKIATQLMHFKNGYRNYVMHLKENYSDRDAKIAIENVEYLFELASQKLQEVV